MREQKQEDLIAVINKFVTATTALVNLAIIYYVVTWTYDSVKFMME